MLNNRLKAAKLVAEKLYAVENAIDDAIAAAGALAIAHPQARKEANLAATVAQDAVAETGAAIAALYEARARMVAAHAHYADVRDGMGLNARMMGDTWKIPPQGKQEEQHGLRAA